MCCLRSTLLLARSSAPPLPLPLLLRTTACTLHHHLRPARRPLPAAPDGSPRTEGSLLVHIDPHIPFLPAFLLNFVLGVLAP